MPDKLPEIVDSWNNVSRKPPKEWGIHEVTRWNQYIQRAFTDIPWLLKEVRDLRNIRENLRNSQAAEKLKALQEENAGLRALLVKCDVMFAAKITTHPLWVRRRLGLANRVNSPIYVQSPVVGIVSSWSFDHPHGSETGAGPMMVKVTVAHERGGRTTYENDDICKLIIDPVKSEDALVEQIGAMCTSSDSSISTAFIKNGEKRVTIAIHYKGGGRGENRHFTGKTCAAEAWLAMADRYIEAEKTAKST